MYVTYDDYTALYGAIDETVFNRCLFHAEKAVEDATRTVDNVNKLAVAFPESERDAQAVKHCICEVINSLVTIEMVKQDINANGGRVINSKSAGNESITYASVDASVVDGNAQANSIKKIVDNNLHGCVDANGVKLLFRGTYPYII